jgi:hypothetical protein
MMHGQKNIKLFRCIVPELRAGRSGVRIPVGAGDFYLLQNVGTGFGATQLPLQRIPWFLPEVKV